MGAGDSATIARELERRLARGGERAEVINLGVIAATLDHLTILARDSISLLRPTDVVVILYANDLPASQYNPIYDQPGPDFRPWKEKWWMPRVLTLFGRFIREEPFYHRWPHPAIRFFAPVPDRANPWSDSKGPPAALDPELYRQMTRGTLNPWLSGQSTDMPRQLAHDFTEKGSPERHLMRMADVCRSVGARLRVAYVPFCGASAHTMHRHWSVWEWTGKRPRIWQLIRSTVVRTSNWPRFALDCTCLWLTRPKTSLRPSKPGPGSIWEYDTHPRPAGYATIARQIDRAFHEPAQ